MFFGLITASVIGQFEETLEQVVILAAFVPMIMDSAGNVGTQSLTVSVRGLALGTVGQGSFSKMIRREFRTRSEEHTSELQSRGHLVCRLLLEKKKKEKKIKLMCLKCERRNMLRRQ